MSPILAYQLPVSRLFVYAAFSSVLFGLTFWRAYLKFSDHNASTSATDDNLNETTIQNITFDAVMQDNYIVVGIFNMVLCLVLLSIKIFQYSFFGVLVGTEPQYLREKLTRFALFRLVFLLGVINSIRWCSLLGWTLWLSCLGALHGFTRLARVRCDQFITSMNVSSKKWVRFSIMITSLLIGVLSLLVIGLKCCLYLSDVTPETDFWGNADDISEDISEGADSDKYIGEQSSDFNQVIHVIIFMCSECLLIAVLIFHVISTLIVNALDRLDLLRSRTWFDRTVWLYYVNFFFEISSSMLELLNHFHMLTWSRILSVTSLIVFIQIRMTYSELSQRYRRHFIHRKLVHFVRKEFPLEKHDPKMSNKDSQNPLDSKNESKEIPESCAICWDLLHSWRKLPCNHCFHETCLTSWMEQNPSCPTCRRPLFSTHSNHTRVTHHRNLITTLRDVIGLFDHDVVQPSNGSPVPAQRVPGVRESQINRTGLPVVRGMAVRLRQVGDSLTGVPVDNPGSSLDLSIRVSLGTRSISPARGTHLPSSVSSQPASPNSENITQNASDSRPSIESTQIIQSTVRRSFFHFDGSRYLSWLPTVHIELSEMFGEMLVPPFSSAETENQNDFSPPEPNDVSNSTSAQSDRQNQVNGLENVTPTNHEHARSTTSSLLSMLFSLFRGNTSRSSSSAHPSLLITPELRAQADQISVMFPGTPIESILLDLASTGVAEATVENILSGQLPTVLSANNRDMISQSPVLSEPSADSMFSSDDTVIRRRMTTSNQRLSANRSDVTPPTSTTSLTPRVSFEIESSSDCISPARRFLLERRSAMLSESRRKFLSSKRNL